MADSSQRPSRLRDRVVLLALLGLTLLPVLLLWREMATGSRSAEGTISEPSAEDEIQAGARLRAPQETATDRRAEPREESARGAHGAGSNEGDGTPLGSASITGRLYDSHDQPVSNAEVSVVATLQGSSPRFAQAVGANGFEITGLFPGSWVLSTTSEGRHAWGSRIDLLANEIRHVDIVLSSTRVVPVYVVSVWSLTRLSRLCCVVRFREFYFRRCDDACRSNAPLVSAASTTLVRPAGLTPTKAQP